MKRIVSVMLVLVCVGVGFDVKSETVSKTVIDEVNSAPTIKICIRLWKGAKLCFEVGVSVENEFIYHGSGDISEGLDIKKMNSYGVYIKDNMLIVNKDTTIPNNEIEDFKEGYDLVLKAGKYRLNNGHVDNLLFYFK